MCGNAWLDLIIAKSRKNPGHQTSGPHAPSLTSNLLCVIMLDMKTANIRNVQHNLREVLRWVEQGHEVRITRRNRTVARLLPAQDAPQAMEWPDFLARANRIWGKRPRGKGVSRLIIEAREERL